MIPLPTRHTLPPHPLPLMLCCLLHNVLVVNTAVVLVVLDCFLYNILNVTFVSVLALWTSRQHSRAGGEFPGNRKADKKTSADVFYSVGRRPE